MTISKRIKPEKQNDPVRSIDSLRSGIDEINNQVLDLINRRLLLAKEIGKVKAQNNEKVLDVGRESAIIEGLFKLNKGPLKNEALEKIFTEIIAASREIQKPQKITYLGPEATFTHIAAMNRFGKSASFFPQPSIRDIFNEVERGACHFGVVPVENSIEGAVNYTLDLLVESDLKICGEIYHTISHDLLSKTGSLNDIKIIYSHPHAFAQCRRWLQKHLPDCMLKECSSTAYAAGKAAKEDGSAAIAGREAAGMYRLQVVASKIEDVARNTTRFLVIGRDKILKTGTDKTSVMFAAAHEPGALYKVLQPIYESGINMLKLESRPNKRENWNYLFFIDLEGHRQDSIVDDTLSKMKGLCLYLKWLGSYPMAS